VGRFSLARFGQRVVRPKEWAQVANPGHLVFPLPSQLLRHPCLRSISAHSQPPPCQPWHYHLADWQAFASTSPPLVPHSRRRAPTLLPQPLHPVVSRALHPPPAGGAVLEDKPCPDLGTSLSARGIPSPNARDHARRGPSLPRGLPCPPRLSSLRRSPCAHAHRSCPPCTGLHAPWALLPARGQPCPSRLLVGPSTMALVSSAK
jgi:hypothetical protein